MSAAVNDPGTPRKQVRAMQILCGALIGGVVIFTLIMIGLNLSAGPTMKHRTDYFNNGVLVVAGLAALIVYVVATRKYKETLKIRESADPLPEKLNRYRAVLISHMALCEGASLFSVIGFFMTGQYLLFIATAAMLALMLSKMPLTARVCNELALDAREQAEIS